MKTLVIYYSYSGINKKLAEEITLKLKADSEGIIDLSDRKNYLKNLFFGSSQALRKIETPIQDLKSDLSKYERVIVCSPVWAGAISPATRTFLNHYENKIKKIDFIFVCGQGKANERKIVPELEKIIKKNKVSALFMKRREIDLENSQKQIFNFLSND